MPRKVLVTKLPNCCRACKNQVQASGSWVNIPEVTNICAPELFMTALMLGQCSDYEPVYLTIYLKDKYTERYLLK